MSKYVCTRCGSKQTALALRAREMFSSQKPEHAWNGPVQVVRCQKCNARWDV